ncbi:MAG: hypothetical protein IJ920_04365 [Paludibacteraceae bacterium]|nr:hypothetical protein [Paludibacteraceae bacterium]
MRKVMNFICLCLCFAMIGFCLSACNVTRTVTTESQYIQRGDTTTTIKVKSIETYDASKKGGVF